MNERRLGVGYVDEAAWVALEAAAAEDADADVDGVDEDEEEDEDGGAGSMWFRAIHSACGFRTDAGLVSPSCMGVGSTLYYIVRVFGRASSEDGVFGARRVLWRALDLYSPPSALGASTSVSSRWLLCVRDMIVPSRVSPPTKIQGALQYRGEAKRSRRRERRKERRRKGREEEDGRGKGRGRSGEDERTKAEARNNGAYSSGACLFRRAPSSSKTWPRAVTSTSLVDTTRNKTQSRYALMYTHSERRRGGRGGRRCV